jgi:hypothetical protein
LPPLGTAVATTLATGAIGEMGASAGIAGADEIATVQGRLGAG